MVIAEFTSLDMVLSMSVGCVMGYFAKRGLYISEELEKNKNTTKLNGGKT